MAKRKLIVEVVGDASKLNRSFKQAQTSVSGFDKAVGVSLRSVAKIGAAVAGLDLLARTIRTGVSEFADQQKAAAQTQAVLKSTGGVAGVTAGQVDKLAQSISNYSGIDDEAIQAGENLLLTFVQIRNGVGKGNDIFNQATKAVADLSVAMGIDATKAALQVGKALNDPARGYARLQRLGVAFTKSQVQQIKTFSRLGETAKAQKVILAELNREFGGSARAFGDTLPGQLKRLQESLRNIAGSIVGALVKPFQAAVAAVNTFVTAIANADGFQAKVAVVFEGGKQLAVRLERAVGDAIAAIDWEAVWARAAGIGDGLQKRLEQVDFSAVGRRIGEGIQSGLGAATAATKQIAKRISDVIGAIDFVALGRSAGPGLAAALATAFVTLADPAFWIKNWDLTLSVALAIFGRGIGRFAGKAGEIVAVKLGSALARISPRLGREFSGIVTGLALVIPQAISRVAAKLGPAFAPLIKTVKETFAKLGVITRFTIKVFGIQIAIDAVARFFAKAKELILRGLLKILEPLSKIPKVLGGGVFQAAKDRVLKGLGEIEVRAKRTSAALEGVALPGPGAGSINRSAAVTGPAGFTDTRGGTMTRRTGVTVSQRNQWFDAGIARQIDRVQDIGTINGQIAALTKIAGAISKRIAATKDVTRRLNLEDKAAEVFRQIRGLRAQKANDLIAALQSGLNAAQATVTLADDLKQLQRINAALRNQIKEQGRTVELVNQLRENERQIADTQRGLRAQRQFRALGFTASGEQITPGVKALRRQLGSISKAVEGTFLDTSKTKSLLSRIRKVLGGGFGKLSQEVRAKVRELLDGINQELKDRASGPRTQTTSLADVVGAAFSGLGLTRAQQRTLSRRFSSFNSAGVGLAGSVAATPAFANYVTVEIDGRKIEASVTKQQQKRARRTPTKRRGR